MIRNILGNWWALITAALGALAGAYGVAGIIIGAMDGEAWQMVGAVPMLVSSVLIIRGLVAKQRRIISGSRMITVGALAMILAVELIPVTALIVIGGLWTGNLQLSPSDDDSSLQLVHQKEVDMTTWWYLWFGLAAILFAVGFGALAILGDGLTAAGEEDTGVVAGLAWIVWILSWLGAIISAGLGIVFGVRRGVDRNRTQLA